MRVPTVDQQSVQAANPYSNTSPLIQQGDPSDANAIGKVGEVVGKAAKVGSGLIDESRKEDAARQKAALVAAAKAKDEADNMLVDGEVVGAQQEATAEDERFRRNQGKEALDESGPALDRVDKIIEKRSENFTDENLRSRFKVKAGAAVLGARKGIESHTTQQFNAGKRATLEGLRSGAINAAAAGNLTAEELAEQVLLVDESFDKLLPPDAAKAAKLELRGDMAAEVISAQVAAGNIDGAVENIDDMAPILGAKRSLQLRSVVASEKRAQDIAKVKVSTEKTVQEMVEAGRGADDFVDETAVEAELVKVPEEKRADTRRLLADRLNQEAAARKRQIDDWKNKAGAAYNEGGYHAIPPRLVEKLQLYDSAFLRQLATAQDIKNARALAMRTGQVAKVRKEESAADKLWLERFRGLPAADRAGTDVKQWSLGKGLSEYGEAKVQTEATRAKDYADKGFGRDSDAFTRLAETKSKALFDAKKAPLRQQEAKRAEYRSEAQEAFDQFVEREKRTPSVAEAQTEIAKLQARTVLVSHWWRPDETGFEFEKRASDRKKDAAPTPVKAAPSKLKPGRYESRSKPGTFFRVDEQGMKHPE